MLLLVWLTLLLLLLRIVQGLHTPENWRGGAHVCVGKRNEQELGSRPTLHVLLDRGSRPLSCFAHDTEQEADWGHFVGASILATYRVGG